MEKCLPRRCGLWFLLPYMSWRVAPERVRHWGDLLALALAVVLESHGSRESYTGSDAKGKLGAKWLRDTDEYH